MPPASIIQLHIQSIRGYARYGLVAKEAEDADGNLAAAWGYCRELRTPIIFILVCALDLAAVSTD